ncbi:hypothetical protein PCI56_26745 [Plesiomonas shigelloides subsp. oncorhynchi]|nr:hypothetical protein [Plesiomonas shigelloides]
MDWALVSGQHYHYYQIEGHDQKDTAALREGRILHKIVLELDDFEREFVVEPEWPEEAISSADQMKAIIQEYNDSLEAKPSIEELIAAIDAHNARLPKPLDAGKNVSAHEVAYDALPAAYQTLGPDDKRTATALKACIKSYNDTLPKPLKTSGGYQAVLDSYAMLGAKEAERLPISMPCLSHCHSMAVKPKWRSVSAASIPMPFFWMNSKSNSSNKLAIVKC